MYTTRGKLMLVSCYSLQLRTTLHTRPQNGGRIRRAGQQTRTSHPGGVGDCRRAEKMQGTTAKTALKSVTAKQAQKHSFQNLVSGGNGSNKGHRTSFKRTASGMSLSERAPRVYNSQRMAVKLDRERPQLSMEEASQMYPPSECILDEMVHRLSGADGKWRRRRMIFHRDVCLFVDMEEGMVIDSIPTGVIAAVARCHEHDEPANDEFAFRITSQHDSTFKGATFTIRARGETSAQIWVNRIAERVEEWSKGPSLLERYQACARRIERHVWFALSAAILIMGNFFCICLEAQITPEPGSDGERNLELVDMMFTICFTLELFVILSGR